MVQCQNKRLTMIVDIYDGAISQAYTLDVCTFVVGPSLIVIRLTSARQVKSAQG